MGPKKLGRLIILNAMIVFVNVLLFSNMFFGLALFSGTAFTIALSWTVAAISVAIFVQGNTKLLKKPETRLLTAGIQNLNDCTGALREATRNGDVFDESLLTNIDQITRFRRKQDTIKDILLQKFSADEMSFQKFSGVLQAVENVIYMNVRSILNKISAFDVVEYEAMQRAGFQGSGFSQEKLSIYNEYIDFVNNATQANEDILLKLDKMLLEISRYNSFEDGDVQKLPAMIELDELIHSANLYK